MSNFIPGLELSRHFFLEAVKPILDADLPGLEYGTALIGPGSEVIGFDTEMSTDHCWGPRLQLFLHAVDQSRSADVDVALRKKLPYGFRSFPTNCSQPDPSDNGTWHLVPRKEGEVNHAVQITTIRRYLLDYIGFDIDDPIETVDWLTFPAQKLRTLRADNVFYDDIGLGAVLKRFAWYPHDVWLYLLVSGWNRIGQEEHLMGRAGSVGDDVGSAIIAARLVRDLMRLCFLMEKQYPPYPKWFGTAFAQLIISSELRPIFAEVLAARSWEDSEDHLAKAYTLVAAMHNESDITEPLRAEIGDFFGRPFKVIHLHGRFAEAIAARIQDPEIRRLANDAPIGNIDQISDNTDLLSVPEHRAALKALYVRNTDRLQ